MEESGTFFLIFLNTCEEALILLYELAIYACNGREPRRVTYVPPPPRAAAEPNPRHLCYGEHEAVV